MPYGAKRKKTGGKPMRHEMPKGRTPSKKKKHTGGKMGVGVESYEGDGPV